MRPWRLQEAQEIGQPPSGSAWREGGASGRPGEKETTKRLRRRGKVEKRHEKVFLSCLDRFLKQKEDGK